MKKQEDDSVRSQVLALADLKDGWLDGEGKAYSPESLAVAADLMERLAGIASGYASPLPDGRVHLEWGRPGECDTLELDPATRTVAFHLYDTESGRVIAGEIAPETSDRVPSDLAARVAALESQVAELQRSAQSHPPAEVNHDR